MPEFGLGRRVQFDERSKAFPIRALVQDRPLRSYTWRVGVNLDQGSEGSCVGHAWAHELAARPSVCEVSSHLARSIYFEAQQIDPWPGGAYPGATPVYEGTSVLAGAQVCQGTGYFAQYRWAFGLNDLLLAVGYAGPAVLGVNWYRDMAEPEADGRIRPRGELLGGHAILAYRVNVKAKQVWLWNSWGAEWGQGGTCWLSLDDLDRLLHEEGEACIPVKRAKPKSAEV